MRDFLELKIIEHEFSVCKLADFSKLDINMEYCFIGKTDEENSLVCPSDCVPDNASVRDDGWRAFRIQGVLAFSLIGILSEISSLLAKNEIGIFAVSTYNTDYIFTKSEKFGEALQALSDNGYLIV